MSAKMFVFDNCSRAFLFSGLTFIIVGLVMAYAKSPRHEFEPTMFSALSIVTFGVLGWLLVVADNEDYVRYFAWAFTIAGLCAPIYPLIDARETLKQPGLVETIRTWVFDPFKEYVPAANVGKGAIAEGADTVFGTGTLTTNPISLPVEERLRLLEVQVSALDARQTQEAASLRRDAANSEASAQQKFEAQTNAANQLFELIVRLQTGGLSIILWGLGWLLIGGTLGGLTKEVVSLVEPLYYTDVVTNDGYENDGRHRSPIIRCRVGA